METAFKGGDEDFLTVNTVKLFLEASPMLHAFESPLPCINLNSFPMVPSTIQRKQECGLDSTGHYSAACSKYESFSMESTDFFCVHTYK